MKKQNIIIFLFSTLLLACAEEVTFPDKLYPTTIDVQTNAQLDQLFNSISTTPIYNCTQLNNYGFFLFDITKNSSCEINDSLKAAFIYHEIIVLAKESIVKYKQFTNVEDTSLLKESTVKTLGGKSYADFIKLGKDTAPPAWYVSFNTQKNNSIEVRGTIITVLIGPQGVSALNGNWYQSIYIPATDALTENEAKTSTYGKTFTSGSYSIKPNAEIEWYKSLKVIVPVKKGNALQLRVCWAVYPTNWEIVIDSQSGEVISTIRLATS